MTHTLQSKQDTSVNWVLPAEGGGYFETRFVQRDPTYFVCYLSVQSGCNHGCRFCGLTATKQTRPVDADVSSLVEQACFGLDWGIEHASKAETVHYNFMARGEPMASKTILERWGLLAGNLSRVTERRKDLHPKFLISTILPLSLADVRLRDVFRGRFVPDLYYSLYNMREGFRRRWMPQALPATDGLDKLAQWQQDTNKIPTIHLAFIQGHNDTERSVENICHAVMARKLRVNVNVVRYNPPDGSLSEEPSAREVTNLSKGFKQWFPEARVQVVDRVGEDVYASCGMFVTADTLKEAP